MSAIGWNHLPMWVPRWLAAKAASNFLCKSRLGCIKSTCQAPSSGNWKHVVKNGDASGPLSGWSKVTEKWWSQWTSMDFCTTKTWESQADHPIHKLLASWTAPPVISFTARVLSKARACAKRWLFHVILSFSQVFSAGRESNSDLHQAGIV